MFYRTVNKGCCIDINMIYIRYYISKTVFFKMTTVTQSRSILLMHNKGFALATFLSHLYISDA